ncbi:ATP-binding protein [Spartinivicinus poritis]|uniref:AAA family ATPase n=1 Tax=Spartinivicinus poritis TaxID=2994640 RepID=A0ABT5UF89_9GAMM|nr:AAA family ATPase [Spartinivicinus sp. A2-2]MDE1465036.1 AAA family ATPase [Spartinivicinus sp. A2-2]
MSISDIKVALDDVLINYIEYQNKGFYDKYEIETIYNNLLEVIQRNQRLMIIKNKFCVDDLYMLLFLLVLHPQISTESSSIYFNINQDKNTLPTIGLLISIIKFYKNHYIILTKDHSLFKWRILLTENYSFSHNKYINISNEVFNFIISNDVPGHDINNCLVDIKPSEHEFIPYPYITNYIRNDLLLKNINLIHFIGKNGYGKKSHSKYLIKKSGKKIFLFNEKKFFGYKEKEDVFIDILTFSNLYNSCIFLESWQDLINENSVFITYIVEWLRFSNCTLFLSSYKKCELPNEFYLLNHNIIEIHKPDKNLRKVILQSMCNTYLDKNLLKIDFDYICRYYTSFPGNMFKACMDLALLQKNKSRLINTTDFITTYINLLPNNLKDLATIVKPKYKLEDLVLPSKIKEQLIEIEIIQKNKNKCNKFIKGKKGLICLLSGPPGTGKTMAASALANLLYKPLYRVDISSTISKWIGETEKNLASLFDEAEKHEAMLFFDEADAIFSKRTSVKSSHDKNANIGISYLLQRVELFNGILILATNYKGNIDKAFMRRVDFSIELPKPEFDERLKLWRTVWSSKVTLTKDIDLVKLAKNFEISPSYIVNISDYSTFLAMEDSIDNENIVVKAIHITKALQRELQKTDDTYLTQEWIPSQIFN